MKKQDNHNTPDADEKVEEVVYNTHNGKPCPVHDIPHLPDEAPATMILFGANILHPGLICTCKG